LNEGKRTRDPLFTGKKHDFPIFSPVPIQSFRMFPTGHEPVTKRSAAKVADQQEALFQFLSSCSSWDLRRMRSMKRNCMENELHLEKQQPTS